MFFAFQELAKPSVNVNCGRLKSECRWCAGQLVGARKVVLPTVVDMPAAAVFADALQEAQVGRLMPVIEADGR